MPRLLPCHCFVQGTSSLQNGLHDATYYCRFTRVEPTPNWKASRNEPLRKPYANAVLQPFAVMYAVISAVVHLLFVLLLACCDVNELSSVSNRGDVVTQEACFSLTENCNRRSLCAARSQGYGLSLRRKTARRKLG